MIVRTEPTAFTGQERVVVYLSRTNLESLLAQVRRTGAALLSKESADHALVVSVEPDAQHYADNGPTERERRRARQGLPGEAPAPEG